MSSTKHRRLTLVLCITTALIGSAAVWAADSLAAPSWLYPIPARSAGAPAEADPSKRFRVPDSQAEFTHAQVTNLFSPPDWHPSAHSSMPAIVAQGRSPDVYACGFCHLPGGQGRPENAHLAGLPAAYIVQQVADFKSGARRSALHGVAYLPTELMMQLALHATPAEVQAAADYFAAQKPTQRVRVMEAAMVPRMRARSFLYERIPDGGEEPLGERVLEFPPDFERHELRDDGFQYWAYVPPGSIQRGEALAKSGGGVTLPCVSCHGSKLEGIGVVPALAGSMPTYIVRQLLAFQTHDRAGTASLPMQAETAGMSMRDMIAVAAYAASLAR